LDERLYRALQRAAVAVLDPFPVGTHVQIMEAMIDGIPVVSQKYN
jgi:predicted O-linked N-acetylglucosamine transferase (SPINDLY family)